MNGTRWAMRPATNATSRDRRSSLATTTGHLATRAAPSGPFPREGGILTPPAAYGLTSAGPGDGGGCPCRFVGGHRRFPRSGDVFFAFDPQNAQTSLHWTRLAGASGPRSRSEPREVADDVGGAALAVRSGWHGFSRTSAGCRTCP